jgi:peptide/nickel transport system substrate-binding protein
MNSYLKPIFFGAILFSVFNSCKRDVIKSDDNLDIRIAKEPEKLNPVYFPSALAREANQYLFSSLIDYDPKSLELIPVLIKSLPVEEKIISGPHKGGVRYNFEILDEAKWDDGKSITINDYIFTLKSILHPESPASVLRSYVRTITAIEVDSTNPKRGSVIFDKYFILSKETAFGIPILPQHIYDSEQLLAGVSFESMLDEKSVEALVKKDSSLARFGVVSNGIKYGKEVVVGSGPYKLSSWNTGENIVLDKKENYWAKDSKNLCLMQNPSKIILHILPDEIAAFSKLKAGQIDLISGVSQENFSKLKKDSSAYFNFNDVQLFKYYSILVNVQDPILKSKKIRQALAYIVDVDLMIKKLENGKGLRTVGPINPLKNYYNKNLKPYAFEPEKSKALLSEEGWGDTNGNGILDKKINGKTTELSLPVFASGELGNNIALIIQAEAKKIGMDIAITKKEFAQIRKENIETGKYSMAMMSNSQDLGLDDLTQKFHSKNAEIGESNNALYSNSALDKVIDELSVQENESSRRELYAKAQTIIHEDLPNIFLYSPKENIIFNNQWVGEVSAKRPGYQANTFTKKK